MRQKIADWPFDDAVPMICQFHIGDDFGLQQADGITGHRVPETGMKLLGHRRPANDIAALNYANLQAGFCKIEGAD